MQGSSVSTQQVLNVLLAFNLLFLSASFLSLNIFAVPIELKVSSFTSKWSRGLGFGSIVYSIVTLMTVQLIDVQSKLKELNDEEQQQKKQNPLTHRVRLATIPVSCAYLFLCLSVLAIRFESSELLYSSVVPLAIPYAFFYLVSVQALIAWIPKRPAMAMALVSASYGASQFFISPILQYAIHYLGVEKALVLTSLSLCILGAVCGLLLRFPTREDLEEMNIKPLICRTQNVKQSSSNSYCSSSSSSSSSHPVSMDDVNDMHQILPWYRLIRMRAFHGYVIVVFLGRAAMGLFPYFFKLGYIFRVPTPTVVIIFQVLSILSVVWAILANSLFEVISNYYGQSSIRPLLFVIFLLQSGLYASLIPVSIAHQSMLAMTIVSALIIMVESQTAFSVILANYMFGPENSVIVYGIGSAIGLAPGEALFTTLMSIMEVNFSVDGKASPATFNLFYMIASACLVIGGILALFLKKCDKVFRSSDLSLAV